MWRFGQFYYQLRKGPHGDVVVLNVALVALMLFVLAVGVIAPILWPVTVAIAIAVVLAIQALQVFLLSRLRAMANDTRYAISFEHGVARAGYVLPDFFMDG